MTKHMESCIRQFMSNFEQPTYKSAENTPIPTVLLRSALIKEESKEYHKAEAGTTDELDGIVDLLYVVIGTNIAMGIPVEYYTTHELFGKIKAVKVQKGIKVVIRQQVLAVTQDLDCRFPCSKLQKRALNGLIKDLIDVAAIQDYDTLGAFNAVHTANMKKLWRTPPLDKSLVAINKPQGWLVRNAAGKVIKPPDFTPADLTPFLQASEKFDQVSDK